VARENLPGGDTLRILKPVRIPLLVVLLLGGCGGAEPSAPPPRAPTRQTAAPAAASPPPVRRGPVTSLDRREVLAVVDAGLGAFLQRVDLEPELIGGQFKGFRIVELRPRDWWAGVDVAPGDVVTQVNGMPIERDTQAYAAFESLRSAKELRVSLRRAGAPRELVLPIVERGDAPPTDAAGTDGG
jgi:S1-C subfamily serine protease